MSQERFLRRGVTKVIFLPKILAATGIPTRPELTGNSATDLSEVISDFEGWALANQRIDTPDLSTTFDSNIPGNDQVDNSSMTFYEDKASDAIETLLSKGVGGFLVFLPKGDVPGSKSMEIFPVRVGSRSRAYSTGNEPAKFKVDFAVTDPPLLDVPVPAAASGAGS